MCMLPEGIKFSFSSLSAYDHCPMSFKLSKIDHLHDDGNFFSQYGSFGHKLFEQYEKGEIPLIALGQEYADRFEAEVTADPPPFPRGLWQKYYDAGQELFDNFNGFDEHYEILEIEQKFEINIGGYPFVGIADLIVRNTLTGGIEVIDHKSKSKNSMKKEIDVYRKQLYTYAMYVHEKYGEWPTMLRFNMYKENYWIDEPFDIKMVKETEDWVVNTIDRIKADTEWFIHEDEYFCCNICGFFMQCPAHNIILERRHERMLAKEQTQRGDE